MKGKLSRETGLRFYVLGGCALLALGRSMAGCSDPTGLDKSQATGGGGSGSGSSSGVSGSFNEDCPADPTWLPPDGGLPPPVPMFDPAPHPDTECPFYRGAYQNFMIVGAPLPNGDPILVNYPTIDDTFVTSYPTGFQRNTGSLDPNTSPDPCVNKGGQAGAATARSGPPSGKAWLGAIKQAGFRNILVDQDQHTLYYGLHMNQAFVDFVVQNNLQTAVGILGDPTANPIKKSVDPNLQFPPGVVEFKTAWKDIDPRDFPSPSDMTYCHTDPTLVPPPTTLPGDPGDYSNYITTMAWVPWIHQDPNTKAITEDPDHPILRKVALVAIHSVYTLPGHPEFIWGSIQHVNTTLPDPDAQTFAGVSILGRPDGQPTATGPADIPALPDPMDPSNQNVKNPPDATHKYLFYTPGTLEKDSMLPKVDTDLTLDEAHQAFAKGDITQVFRVFAGSKADQLAPDGAIFSLNNNLNALYQSANLSSLDKRQNYRLVAAVWMDKPSLFGLGALQQGAYPGMPLQNDGTSPLVVAAQNKDPMPLVSQGVSCGVPVGPNGKSGDVPGVTAMENTVPGCDTRADDLHLTSAEGANDPTIEGASEEDGGPIDPAADFASHAIGTDSPFSILGGEDRLSSTSMETFTQNAQFVNCFSCHNTQPTSANGVAADPTCITANPPPGCVLPVVPFAAKINVSHMFSEFLLDEQAAAARAAARGAAGH